MAAAVACQIAKIRAAKRGQCIDRSAPFRDYSSIPLPDLYVRNQYGYQHHLILSAVRKPTMIIDV